ncbi:hypothetical protein VO71_16980 [Aeromonas salmonicida subsp. smithia]|nr:hypothetical protein VO71_16980 [Aeromonas salmonicida subsp. smithia]
MSAIDLAQAALACQCIAVEEGRFLIQMPAASALFHTFPALVWGRPLTMDGIVTIFALAKG